MVNRTMIEQIGDNTSGRGGTDREELSMAKVTELVDRQPDGDVELPLQWEINRDHLPAHIRKKLAARSAAGLPNPIHAHGASAIAAFDERERSEFLAKYPIEAASGVAADRPLHWGMTERQALELRKALPFDGALEPAPRNRRTTVDDALVGWRPFDFYAVPGLVVRPGPVCAAAGVSVVAFLGGVWPGLIVAILLVLMLGTAQLRAWETLDLTSTDYIALERASFRAAAPEAGSREHRLAQVAVSLSHTIETYPVWQSEILALHRIRLDPAAEAAQVIEHATRISGIRAALGPAPAGDTEAAERAREQRSSDEQILDQVLASLIERVAALYRYADELHTLNDEYEALRGLERSLMVNPDLAELVRQTGSDVIAADALNRLARDAEALRVVVQAQVQVLDGDLSAYETITDRRLDTKK
ncbi:hypothetical protein [Rhodococcus sp. T7]|uniref:hypothetical protein n=1 Tax=Rhodococcus sp. T7 TaxID=627444 RepID=UPI001358EA62|nr:hypothetical protein [Rhodococcus sp. T7]KAF0966656.1 hypothetical protein MLGJGCBP_00205 [Rhodococcus sp. T7]